jgi:hypothetical protein
MILYLDIANVEDLFYYKECRMAGLQDKINSTP